MRNNLNDTLLKTGSNPGLLLQRYLKPHPSEKEKPACRENLYVRAIAAAARAVDVYKLAFARREIALPPITAKANFKTSGRLIVGLGAQNVLETGLTLNPIYGLPIIPGSSLKGLANHYCHSVWGEEDKRYRRNSDEKDKFHNLLFGTTDDAGTIVFHDAWILPDKAGESLHHDVMTPHHPHWMDEKAVPPSDFDSPIPIRYLTVEGTFQVAVSWNGPDHPQSKGWTDKALKLLTLALDDWGVGGKTSSGYGRLVDESFVEKIPKAVVATTDGKVEVTILEAKPKAGPNAFSVQETGKPKGMLVHGLALNPLPMGGDKIRVFRESTSNPTSPNYRWTLAAPLAPPPRGKPRSGPRR